VSQARVAEIEANPGVVSVASMLKLLSALGAGLQLQVHDAHGSASMAPMTAQGSGTQSPEPPAVTEPKRGSW
jgi:HTH-type transcriptional regulator/antitoxin HipB